MITEINQITQIRKQIIRSELINENYVNIFLSKNFSDNNVNFNLNLKQFLFSILITRKFNEKLKFTKDKNFLCPYQENGRQY